VNYFAAQEKGLQLTRLVATLKALRKCEVCICQIVSSTLLLWCGLTRDHSCGSAFFLFVFSSAFYPNRPARKLLLPLSSWMIWRNITEGLTLIRKYC
jgi:hypothetical protein